VILEALRGAPALAAIATQELAAELGALVTRARPVELVEQALQDLARKAAAARAVGAPMGRRELALKAVSFAESARPRAAQARSWGAAAAPADRSPPLPPVDQKLLAAGWRAMAEAATRPAAARRI
jgi:hypothetical protein